MSERSAAVTEIERNAGAVEPPPSSATRLAVATLLLNVSVFVSKVQSVGGRLYQNAKLLVQVLTVLLVRLSLTKMVRLARLVQILMLQPVQSGVATLPCTPI